MGTDNKSYDWSDKTILIVEDTDTSVMYYRAALKKTKVKLVYADNGQSAVDLIESGSSFDLILMDINMPVMNGIDATKKIKEFAPQVPIIIQTAYVLNDERIRSFDAGCDGFMAKPVKIQQLFATMESLL
ncbi:MAG: response regulator [Chlorobi bacterium]|nr:response regulator [Chlorobiota bacterium]